MARKLVATLVSIVLLLLVAMAALFFWIGAGLSGASLAVLLLIGGAAAAASALIVVGAVDATWSKLWPLFVLVAVAPPLLLGASSLLMKDDGTIGFFAWAGLTFMVSLVFLWKSECGPFRPRF